MGLLLLLASCESIDCTLNNVVACNYAFYDSETGAAVSLSDTLTVTALGTDSVLYNRGTHVSTLSLPLSYWQEADTLRFHVFNEETGLDTGFTLRVSKTNTPHYESPDCPTTMFHGLTAAEYDDPTGAIDSIVISNPNVNYAAQENIRIYLHTAAAE